MSALPPKADIGTQSRNVRFVPKADIPGIWAGQLINHFRRLNENRRWHTEIEQLGGLEINDELETGRLLYRQVSWPLASQDLVDIGGGTPPCLD